jgi:hypothetical protein
MPNKPEFVQSLQPTLRQATFALPLNTYPLTKAVSILCFIALWHAAMTLTFPVELQMPKSCFPVVVKWIPDEINIVQSFLAR